MGRQRIVVAAFGAVVVAAAGAALFLVLAQPPAAVDDVADTTAPTAPTEEPQESAPEKRRHAGHAGNASLVGRLVRGKDRVPVAGETVRLDREGLPGWSVATGDDGVFRFERLPHGGPFTMSAAVADCAPVSLPGLALDRRQELDVGDVRLDRAVSVTIVVRTPGDTPVEGALVEAFAQTEEDWTGDWTKRLAQMSIEPVAVGSLRTSATGEARFDALATGRWGFRAVADGYSRSGRSSLLLEPEDDDDREPVVIRLWPGHTLTGRVVDQDGRPLPGALVMALKPNQAWSPNAAMLFHRATADAEGRYALDRLPAGELSLQAARAGGIPTQVAVLRVPELSTFEIRLRLGGALEGTVTEAGSHVPVPDVEVRAMGWGSSSQRVGIAVTDAEGHYVIDSMLEGVVNQVTVDRPGWVIVQQGANPWQQIALQRGSTATHDIEIRKGAAVTGVVRGPDGPLAGASVTLHATSAQGWDSKSARCDAAGRFRVEGLTAGKGLIQANAPGHVQRGFPQEWWEALNNRTIPEEWSVDIPDDGAVERDVLLARGGAAEGIVRDAEGEPVAGATIRVWGAAAMSEASAETAADGTFRVAGLPFDADATLTASARGHAPATKQVRGIPDDVLTGIELTLRPQAMVRGTISTPDGSPPRNAFVRLSQPQAFDGGQPYNWQDPERRWDAVEPHPVRPDGTYEVPLPFGSGKLVVRASADGFAATECEPVAIDEARVRYQVDVALGPGLVLAGRVVDAATSAPVAGATVAAGTLHPLDRTQPWMAQNVMPPLRAVTDADGRFAVSWSQEAQIDVRVRRDGYVEAKLTPRIPQKGELEVRLAPALRIAGVVRFPDGSAVVGAQISYQGSTPQHFYANAQVITGGDGAFEIRDLAKGAYTVAVQAPWNNGAVNIRGTEVAGVQAGTQDLAITVTTGLSVTGRVLGPDGEGVGNTWVNAQPEPADKGGSWRGANTAGDGTFEIVGLEEGTYTLHVTSANGTRNEQVPGVAAGTQDLVIRLAEGLEIRGEVVDEQGEPVAGESLYAMRIVGAGEPQQAGGQSVVQSGSDGAFVIPGLAPGEYTIRRSPSADAARRNHVLEGGGRVAAGTTGVRLVLSSGATIRGVVTDASGNAVRGAQRLWVRARIVGQQADKWASVTPDGSFEIAGLAPDVDYELRTMGGGFRPAAAGPFPGGTDGVRLVVEPGLTCTGRLVDHRGDGIEGVTVTFRDGETDDYTWAQTGADGGFEASGLVEGEYGVTAWVQSLDASGNRTGQQRQVELGKIVAGSTGVLLEVPAE